MSTPAAANSRSQQIPALGPETPVSWPPRLVRKLGNGMLVVLAESRAFPTVSAQLFFRSGNAAVARTHPGLAGMTATMVRAGTHSRTESRIEEDLRRMGAGLSTHSGADSIHIAVSGLAEFSSELLELVSDLARNASFPQPEFERERRRQIEELRVQRTTPGFLASERFRRVLFGDHPYAVVAPAEEQVAAYRREELADFYARHYSPAHALLIAVGDFCAEEFLAEIERVFGAWKSPAPARPPEPEPPRHSGRSVYLVDVPGTVQTNILVGNLGITRRDPAWFSLVLANAIFGGAFHSRLIINIREQKGYTYSPRSGLTALRRHGYFSIHAAVRNDVVAATLTEIFYELDRMRSLPVTADELESAQNYLSGVFSLGVATQDGLLGQLSTIYLDHLPEDFLENYRHRVRALTAEDVLAASRRHFDSANAQLVVVGDRNQIAGQAALFGPLSE